MAWRWREAEPLLAHRHSRIVDSLHVDAPVLEQKIRGLFRLLRVADEHRDDMARVRHDGQIAGDERGFGGPRVELLQFAVAWEGNLVLDGGFGAGHGRGREGGGENEARGEAADGVDHVCFAGDVAADAAVGFT